MTHFRTTMPMPMPGVGSGSAPAPERGPARGPGIAPPPPPGLQPRRNNSTPPPRQQNVFAPSPFAPPSFAPPQQMPRSFAPPSFAPPPQMPPGPAQQPASRGIGTAMALGALTGGVSLKQMALGALAGSMGGKLSGGALAMAAIGHSMTSGFFQSSDMLAHGVGHALDLAGPVLSPFTPSGWATAAMVGYNPFDAMAGAAMGMPFHLFSR